MLEPLRSPTAKHSNRSRKLTELAQFNARRQEWGLIHFMKTAKEEVRNVLGRDELVKVSL